MLPARNVRRLLCLAVMLVCLAKIHGYQQLNRFSEHFFSQITKYGFRLLVEIYDGAARVCYNDPNSCVIEQSL